MGYLGKDLARIFKGEEPIISTFTSCHGWVCEKGNVPSQKNVICDDKITSFWCILKALTTGTHPDPSGK